MISAAVDGAHPSDPLTPDSRNSSMSGLAVAHSVYVNPSQTTHNAQAGPSSLSADPKRKIAANPKRKRTGTPEESADSSHQQRKNRDGSKKKKASRACAHCQKAHLTCDDSRPCQRCIKRGIADSCTEGHRKKAKYLLDDEELERMKRSKSGAPEANSEPPTSEHPITVSTEQFQSPDPLYNMTFDSNFTFGSEAANLEYSILSAILGNPSPADSNNEPSPPLAYPSNLPAPAAWPQDALLQTPYDRPQADGNTDGFGSSYSNSSPRVVQPTESTMPTSTSGMAADLIAPYPSPTQYRPQPPPGPPIAQIQTQHQEESRPYSPTSFPRQDQVQPPQELHPLAPRYPIEDYNSAFYNNVGLIRTDLVRSVASPASSHTSPSSTSSQNASGDHHGINDRVTAPYDYTEGYHFLMKHLPTRFEKNDILRIVRALAIFRPSLIALQMPMTDEDEVFVEKCFQRSLMELEKLISFSGTPTVIWRRTGEICLVAPEFCMLTEWSIEELVGKRKYIYELLENQSVVEYWENFASHAFENSTKSVYSHCVLLKPSGAPIPATFCFSIRRDVFDLPSIVIGQWLPLL